MSKLRGLSDYTLYHSLMRIILFEVYRNRDDPQLSSYSYTLRGREEKENADYYIKESRENRDSSLGAYTVKIKKKNVCTQLEVRLY